MGTSASASSSARDHHRHGDLTTRRVVSDDAQRWRWRRASPAPSPSPSSSVRRRPRRVDANDAAANPNLSYYEVDDAELNARGDGDDGDDDGVPEMSSKEMFKRLVRFTLPTMAIWVCGPILGMIDTAVVGSASTLELAAMSPGGVYVDYPSYLISSALAVATTTLVAQDRLAEKRERKAAGGAEEKKAKESEEGKAALTAFQESAKSALKFFLSVFKDCDIYMGEDQDASGAYVIGWWNPNAEVTTAPQMCVWMGGCTFRKL